MFSEWYSKKIAKAPNKGQDIHEVKLDTTLTVMKHIHAQWIIGIYDHLRNDVELTRKSLIKVEVEILRQWKKKLNPLILLRA